MTNYIKLMRLKHSIKNLLIFVPLLFSGNFLNLYNIKVTFIGFVVFTLIASSIYIINDIRDKDKDAKHPTKCKRPIASGKIPVKNAIIFCVILFIICAILVVASNMTSYSIILLLIYFVMNLCYSFGAKNVPLLDIVILVTGFVIRVLFGGSLLNIALSNWLILTIITISFYLSLGKRRNEIERNGSNSRKVLEYYSKDFLDKNMYMLLSTAIVFYSLWTVDGNIVQRSNNLLIWTIPIVIIIAMRYSMNIESNSDGDPIEVILNDKVLIGLGIIYVMVLFVLLYVI